MAKNSYDSKESAGGRKGTRLGVMGSIRDGIKDRNRAFDEIFDDEDAPSKPPPKKEEKKEEEEKNKRRGY